MYELSVDHDFDAAHFLRGYQGKCERLHGHRFVVRATLRSGRLDKIGLAYDFTLLKQHLKEVLARLDHMPLNETPPFDRLNPTSENIARAVFEELKARMGAEAGLLYAVTVWESPGSQVTYTP